MQTLCWAKHRHMPGFALSELCAYRMCIYRHNLPDADNVHRKGTIRYRRHNLYILLCVTNIIPPSTLWLAPVGQHLTQGALSQWLHRSDLNSRSRLG